VLTVEQPEDQQGAVLLWGAAVDWLPRFSRDKGAVWDFRVLLVREGLTSDLPELHSTPWSTVQAVDPTDRRVQDFHRTRRCQKGNSSTPELDLDTLLSQKYSELDTDANDIYRPCYPCLPHTGEELHKEFLVSDPSWCDSRRLRSSCLHLFCSSAPGSEVKHIQVAAERIHTLLSLPRKTFIATIRSNFLCDENSIPISQDFTLLDLQFLPEPR
uniref:Shieldin complex subunit 2 n=1 Tax=Pundamilia nyererei TaxID=303518 RepID=A0A3B4GY86_9CICH